MTEQPQSPESNPSASVNSTDGSSPPQASIAAAGDRPEVAVGAAFAGGFLVAMILRRLAR